MYVYMCIYTYIQGDYDTFRNVRRLICAYHMTRIQVQIYVYIYIHIRMHVYTCICMYIYAKWYACV